jgi:hypothetical protein
VTAPASCNAARNRARRQWSVSMALWKIEHSPARKFVLNEPTRFLDLVGLIAIAAAPGFVLLLLIPLPLVLPVLSILSFAIACGVALYALFTKKSRDTQGIAIWDIAYAFTFIWIVAGLLSNPKHLLDWFDSLSMVP